MWVYVEMVIISIYYHSVWLYNPKLKCTSRKHIAWKTDNVVHDLCLFIYFIFSFCFFFAIVIIFSICSKCVNNLLLMRKLICFKTFVMRNNMAVYVEHHHHHHRQQTTPTTKLLFSFYFINYLTMCVLHKNSA